MILALFLGFISFVVSQGPVSIITFYSPAPGTEFIGGNVIPVLLNVTNAASAVVTVNLVCDQTTVSATGSTNDTINFQSGTIGYGSCLMTMNPVQGFITENTTSVILNRELLISLPTAGQTVTFGQSMSILVQSPSGGYQAAANLGVTCNAGPSADFDVSVGVTASETVNFGTGAAICTAVARSTDPYFVDSDPVQLTVLVPLSIDLFGLNTFTGGQTIQVSVNTADGNMMELSLLTTCPLLSYLPESPLTSDSLSDYTFPLAMSGITCVMSTVTYQAGYIAASVNVHINMSPEQQAAVLSTFNFASFSNLLSN